MFAISIIFVLFGINLFDMITDDGMVFYKDIRFWIVLVSLVTLIILTMTSCAII